MEITCAGRIVCLVWCRLQYPAALLILQQLWVQSSRVKLCQVEVAGAGHACTLISRRKCGTGNRGVLPKECWNGSITCNTTRTPTLFVLIKVPQVILQEYVIKQRVQGDGNRWHIMNLPIWRHGWIVSYNCTAVLVFHAPLTLEGSWNRENLKCGVCAEWPHYSEGTLCFSLVNCASSLTADEWVQISLLPQISDHLQHVVWRSEDCECLHPAHSTMCGPSDW